MQPVFPLYLWDIKRQTFAGQCNSAWDLAGEIEMTNNIERGLLVLDDNGIRYFVETDKSLQITQFYALDDSPEEASLEILAAIKECKD